MAKKKKAVKKPTIEAIATEDTVRAHNKPILLKALKKVKAANVIVTYSGSGDSGMVDNIEMLDSSGRVIEANPEVTVKMRSSRFENGGWLMETKNKSLAIRAALEDLAYGWIGENHGGWENNGGGQGTLTIDVKNKEFHLHHEENYTETESYEYKL